MVILIIIIYLLLGAHSVYYFIRCYTRHYDLTSEELSRLLICFMAPIVTHFATYMVYGRGREGGEKVWFKKGSIK